MTFVIESTAYINEIFLLNGLLFCKATFAGKLYVWRELDVHKFCIILKTEVMFQDEHVCGLGMCTGHENLIVY